MSTAVLISGQARSFGGTDLPNPDDYPAGKIIPAPFKIPSEKQLARARQPWAHRTFENQYWYLYRQLDDPEFFVSLANDEHAAEVEPLLLSRYPRERVHVEIIDQPTLPEPDVEKCFHSAYCCSSPPQSIMRDLWHRQRVWEFWKEKRGVIANQFVRLRPDSYFQTVRPCRANAAECCVPYWSSFGGVNDRFALMDYIAAPSYFRAFYAVDDLLAKGCPFHPETLLAGALKAGNVAVNRHLPVHFFTLRRNGDVIPMTLEESVVAYADISVGAS